MKVFNYTLISELEEKIITSQKATNIQWCSICTFLVFLMQAGFTLIESGSTRYKNYLSAILKNIIVISSTTLAWWLFGFSFAYGKDKSGFIGEIFKSKYYDFDDYTLYSKWLFTWAFAGTASTIVSGAILERMKLWGYFIFSLIMSSWIYPLIVHWCWHKEGWLNKLGYSDFSGSGVVHIVGGSAGLAATIILGTRKGRFINNSTFHDNIKKELNNEFRPTYMPFICLGTLMLWFSWYGFNCGSTVTVMGKSKLIAKIAINTTISAGVSGFSSFIIKYFFNKKTNNKYDLPTLCNGILAGLVAITGGTDSVETWAAFIIGFIASIIYLSYSKFFEFLKIDDPLDACAIHLGAGSWGLVSVGWFHNEKGILFGNSAYLLGINLLGMLVIFAWTFTWTSIIFYLLNLINLQRVSESDEIQGIDRKYCGGFVDNYDLISIKYHHRLFDPSRQTDIHKLLQDTLNFNNEQHLIVENVNIDSEQKSKYKANVYNIKYINSDNPSPHSIEILNV